MGKRAIVVFRLVQESNEVDDEEIKKEISKELSDCWPRIPWVDCVDEIRVTQGP